MSKNIPLTAQEYDQYKTKGAFLPVLRQYAETHHLTPAQINVLDWGCGRGRLVLRLRELGYNAFGVDVDPQPMQNGRDLFIAKGLHSTNLAEAPFPLNLLEADGRSAFPDGFFHCVFSGQVLEHVRDLESAAAEMARLTARGGIGDHNYPAQRHVVEAHLYMPFVHWLPKTSLRRRLITLYLLLGVNRAWDELQAKGLSEQAEAYFTYSVNKTFYRPAAQVKGIFERCGFQARYDALSHPRLTRLRPFLKSTWLRQAANNLLTTFVLAELYLAKP